MPTSYLAEIGETPCGKNYSSQKIKRITEAMQHTVITGNDGSEMIQQLKEKFEVSEMIQQLKEKFEVNVANSHCFAQKLDSKEQ